jgi:beta-phosphoglucomutase-like phosphatase (HAD superfamily)
MNKKTESKIIISPDIKAIIFDCDGTLVDSMPTHMKAWEYAFNHFKTKYDEEFIFSFKGMMDADIVKIYNKTFGTTLAPDKVISMKSEYFLKNLPLVKPIEPVVEVAELYYQKLPLAVVSGSTKEIVYSELNFAGLTKLFDIIITAADPFAPKPDPEIFLAAASKMKVEPEYCIVLEDGDAGLEGAVKAGMKTFDVRTILT